MELEAVTFDFWNTLASEERGHLRGRRLEAWVGILEDAGYATERQQLEAAMDVTWEAYVRSWRSGAQFQAAEAAVHCVEAAGIDVPDDIHAALIEAFTSAGATATLHLTPNIGEVLDALRERGVRLGIVCDVGFTPSHILRAHLEGAGVLDRFDGWAFSDEVGVYKPDRRIFEHALAEMGGPDPERAAHVGDLRRTDVAGALGMGMTAVRYAGIYDDAAEGEPEGPLPPSDSDAPEAHHVITDHRELLELLAA